MYHGELGGTAQVRERGQKASCDTKIAQLSIHVVLSSASGVV